MATPGTNDYYHLPIAQRKADYEHQIASAQKSGLESSAIPSEAYFTPAEVAYLQAASHANLQPWQTEVVKKYPAYAAYLNNPEIAAILHEAIQPQNMWAPDVLKSHLEASTWWLSHSPEQRSWAYLNMTDPAAALHSMQGQFQGIFNSARLLGLNLNTSQLMTLSVEALSMGWTQEQLTEHMISASRGPIRGGTMGATRDSIKAMADDYLLPMSDHNLDMWTKRIAAGTATPDVVKDQLSRQAMTRYTDPGIKEALKHGMTIREFADPYVQYAAQTLGVNPNDIDLSQPRWMSSIDHVGSDGNRRAMTMDEWQQKIKLDPTYGYDRSRNGLAEAAQLVNSLKEQFGFA